MNRAPTYFCNSQGKKKICILFSLINSAAHNICSLMDWTTPDYQINTSFGLNSNCITECRDTTSSHCKCCLLRIYIRTIILNNFPSMIEEGANLELVTLFVNLRFNEIFLSENLYETINMQLSGVNPDIVTALTNVFEEIKSRRVSIGFNKYFINKGNLYERLPYNQLREHDYNSLQHLLNENNLYALIDENGPLIDLLTQRDSIDHSLLKDPKVLCGENQVEINEFMDVYFRNTMTEDVFYNLKIKIESADGDYVKIYTDNNGHAMVLKCIFWYKGRPYGLYKNSWSSSFGFNGEDVAPLDVFLHCKIYVPIFKNLTEDELKETQSLLELEYNNLAVKYYKLKLEKINQKLAEVQERSNERVKQIDRIHKEVKRYEKKQGIIPEETRLKAIAIAEAEEAARLKAQAPPVKRSRVVKNREDSLVSLFVKPKETGGNSSSKKIRCKKSRRNKKQKQKEKKQKTVKCCRQMRKTRRKI